MLLIEKGADINARNNEGRTPLLYATVTNNTELSRLLIEKGADIHAKDNDGYTPLQIANGNKNMEIMRLLG